MAAADAFDWFSACAAVVQTGACEAVLAGDTEGNVFSSFPLTADGNYKFWVRGAASVSRSYPTWCHGGVCGRTVPPR